MVRRDYQLLTDVLKTALDKTALDHDYIYLKGKVIEPLAEALAQDNKAFDKDKFINDIRGL